MMNHQPRVRAERAQLPAERPVRTLVVRPDEGQLPTDRLEPWRVRVGDEMRTAMVRVRDVDYLGQPVVGIPRDPIVEAVQDQAGYNNAAALVAAQTHNPDAAIVMPHVALAARNARMANQLMANNAINPMTVVQAARLYGDSVVNWVLAFYFGADAAWRNAWLSFFRNFIN